MPRCPDRYDTETPEWEIPRDAARVSARPIEIPEPADVLSRSFVETPDVLRIYAAGRFTLAQGDTWPKT